jgi:hypothetical protein
MPKELQCKYTNTYLDGLNASKAEVLYQYLSGAGRRCIEEKVLEFSVPVFVMRGEEMFCTSICWELGGAVLKK